MASRTRPYEQFGPFILFKKLETDALSDLWRAGRIDGDKLAGLVALRRLTGGNREALAQNAAEARNVAPLLTGTSFVKNQVIDIVESVPVIWHDYGGGRSLSGFRRRWSAPHTEVLLLRPCWPARAMRWWRRS